MSQRLNGQRPWCWRPVVRGPGRANGRPTGNLRCGKPPKPNERRCRGPTFRAVHPFLFPDGMCVMRLAPAATFPTPTPSRLLLTDMALDMTFNSCDAYTVWVGGITDTWFDVCAAAHSPRGYLLTFSHPFQPPSRHTDSQRWVIPPPPPLPGNAPPHCGYSSLTVLVSYTLPLCTCNRQLWIHL